MSKCLQANLPSGWPEFWPDQAPQNYPPGLHSRQCLPGKEEAVDVSAHQEPTALLICLQIQAAFFSRMAAPIV